MLTYLVLVLISLASANRHEYHPSAKSRSYKSSRFNRPTSDPSMYKHTGKSVPNPGRPASRQAIPMTWSFDEARARPKSAGSERASSQTANRALAWLLFPTESICRSKSVPCPAWSGRLRHGGRRKHSQDAVFSLRHGIWGETRCRKNGQSR